MLENKVIEGRWIVGAKIGSGGQGAVYRAKDNVTGHEVAIKIQELGGNSPRLIQEFQVYSYLSRYYVGPGGYGLPAALGFLELPNIQVLILELMGPSLQALFNYHEKVFSLKTVLLLAKDLIRCLENLHGVGIIHRDIKPENICMGRGEQVGVVHLIDFGHAASYQKKNGQHLPPQKNRPFLGTVRYASTNAHRGLRLSRRDDLESLAYTLMYLSKGTLPWQGSWVVSPAETRELVLAKKSIAPEELCKGYPAVLRTLLTYSRDLRFDEEPDYSMLYSLFEKALQDMGFENDGYFDWFCSRNGQKFDRTVQSFEKHYDSIMFGTEKSKALMRTLPTKGILKSPKSSEVRISENSTSKNFFSERGCAIPSKRLSMNSEVESDKLEKQHSVNSYRDSLKDAGRKGTQKVKNVMKTIFSKIRK